MKNNRFEYRYTYRIAQSLIQHPTHTHTHALRSEKKTTEAKKNNRQGFAHVRVRSPVRLSSFVARLDVFSLFQLKEYTCLCIYMYVYTSMYAYTYICRLRHEELSPSSRDIRRHNIIVYIFFHFLFLLYIHIYNFFFGQLKTYRNGNRDGVLRLKERHPPWESTVYGRETDGVPLSQIKRNRDMREDSQSSRPRLIFFDRVRLFSVFISSFKQIFFFLRLPYMDSTSGSSATLRFLPYI